MGISDLKIIKNTVNLTWNGQKNKVRPGMNEVQFKYHNAIITTGKANGMQ